jgi:heptosyltransferase-1
LHETDSGGYGFKRCGRDAVKILIVKLSAIGDVIHTLPALNAIRKHYPTAHITWLVETNAADLLIGHEALDRVLISRRKQWVKGLLSRSWLKQLKEIKGFIKALRDTRYDIIFDFQALIKSGILIWMCRGDRKIGFDRGMAHSEHSHLFLNVRIPPVSMEHHALLRQLMLIRSVGIEKEGIVYDLPVRLEDRARAEHLLKQGGIILSRPIVGINPGAKWQTKLWSDKRFAELADRLIRHYHFQVVFTGSQADVSMTRRINAFMKCGGVNLVGKTGLKTLAALYEKLAFLISTDTGPMHLAAAVGIPVVALFGPTAPWRTGPFGPGHQVVRATMDCSPCFKRTCDTYICMDRISVTDVLQAVEKVQSL